MEKILVPVDFTEVSDNALKYALAFAERVGGTVTLFHSISYPGSDPLAPAYSHSTSTVAQSEMIKQKETLVTKNLQQTVQALRQGQPGTVEVDYIIAIGFPVEEILRVTDEQEFNLVIMGTKGEKGLEDTILGTITSNTMVKVKCPVLAVPGHESFKLIKRIAYATDYHEDDEAALLRLLKIANYFDAQIFAVHVADEDEVDEEDSGNYKLLQILGQDAFKDRVSLNTVQNDNVEKGLKEFIDHNQIDLVALMHRNMNFFQRLFDPSLSKKMALHAKKPFMVFHHNE